MVLLGLVLRMVGIDVSGTALHVGISELSMTKVSRSRDGDVRIEIINNLELKGSREVFTSGLKLMLGLTKGPWKAVIGLPWDQPGIQPAVVPYQLFRLYALEKRVATVPSRFGKGKVKGAGRNPANNQRTDIFHSC
jgi:TctA family transporter